MNESTVAYVFEAIIMETQQPTVTRQRPVNKKKKNGVFCAVRADDCIKQQWNTS
jgi:hypothetical protein